MKKVYNNMYDDIATMVYHSGFIISKKIFLEEIYEVIWGK